MEAAISDDEQALLPLDALVRDLPAGARRKVRAKLATPERALRRGNPRHLAW